MADAAGTERDQLVKEKQRKRKRALEEEGEDGGAPKKKLPNYSSVAERMMASMGYVPGKGLGKTESGIAEPIEQSIHKGRRGLGLRIERLQREDVQWELEEVNCEQEVTWLAPCYYSVLTEDEMTNWIDTDERKNTIEDETKFCEPVVLEGILAAKTVFDSLEGKEFTDARQRSNPFETIKGVIFQNRATMKMANIDSVFDFMFTSSTKDKSDILYFADICAGPGGFSEYVFWRKKWHAKGFGFTLKDPNDASDFQLDKFLAGPCETFDPFYGVGGYDGDGDITRTDNLLEFQQYVLEQTEGVHFVMADGGICVDGEENIQEILTKRLVLCQYLCALMILRTGGHFVCKIFDQFTPFSVGLFYLLYRCFEQVCIFKPVTSRPANSERYVICKSLRPDTDDVCKYMLAVNIHMGKIRADEDGQEIVPLHLLLEDPFLSYIKETNNEFGLNQIIALKKLRYYVKNTNLQDTRQSKIRSDCLELWKVPNKPRADTPPQTAIDIFNDVWKKVVSSSDQSLEILASSSFTTVTEDAKFLVDVHSWKWFWAAGRRYLLVGLGRNTVRCWDMSGQKPSFTAQREITNLELPKGTVIEIELVAERVGEGAGQLCQNFAYITDVLAVHEEIFVSRPLKERQQIAEKLCKVLNKPCRRQALQLKVKRYQRLNELENEIERLVVRKCKAMGPSPTIDVSEDAQTFIAPFGVVFCKVVKDPWQLHLSKHGNFYFFNKSDATSVYEPPKESIATYLSVVKSRHLWKWSRQKDFVSDLCGTDTPQQSSASVSSEMKWSQLKTLLNQRLH